MVVFGGWEARYITEGPRETKLFCVIEGRHGWWFFDGTKMRVAEVGRAAHRDHLTERDRQSVTASA